ncbi:peptidoglycan binding protein CsiV [Pseudomonas guariconensis]|uniref:peptidoglycan binding protein CsiV n=1 Tax=Pseudomonas TaxID=286 RepID=UPI001CE4A3B9|nr:MULTISPECIES: peptidoglycan binding protein CsiV [Pseudomonas]MCO7636293.1 peptidoglycan binding protein CsiV [Pseudomonas sp. S 311-6]MCO7515048.1 peptidoglycan binding protein CsiV [Pseudomonas putida]MCO7563864.1 peptidoglycan binding protein CsiV [Pseudomonas mosselii]MCO7594218.1 peptidoglycan binding protein CsiV [Pseudomonas guariconensis]MCO7604824.1 peptidoglycan binding protein CsiV [Pseudomonas guariconensis]
MRAIRCLTLLLTLIAPAAFAEGPYQVEMILVRQNAVPAVNSPFAPEDWSAGAPRLNKDAERPTALNDEVTRLQATPSYTVLLHKAWQQQVGSEPSRIALGAGQEQFGHFPIEGNLSIAQGRFITVEANFWVNQLDGNGSVLQSEQFRQSNSTMKANQLTFLDGGHLALLLKIAPVGERKLPVLSPEMMEQ